MSSDDKYLKLMNNPKFIELVSKRSKFAWVLSFIILIAYFSFILIIAFFPHFFGTPLYEGSTTTIGIPIGILMIFLSFFLTKIYVDRANGEFDRLTDEIVKESEE